MPQWPWPTKAKNGLESSVGAVEQAQRSTSRSDRRLLVSHYLTNIEKAMLRGDSEYFYHRRQSLPKPENNTRLLLTWSFMPRSQILEALRYWVGSEEGLRLYQKLIDDLWLQQTPEEFLLTLAVLLSRERLLMHN